MDEISNDDVIYSDILGWWRQNDRKFPRIATLARYYFAIPASSAFSERCFSVSGNTKVLKRTSLKEDTLEMLTVLKSVDPKSWIYDEDSDESDE